MSYIPGLVQSGTNLVVGNNLTVSGQMSSGLVALSNQSADPASPTNSSILYTKADNKLYFRTPTGIETVIGPDGGQAEALNVKNSPYFAKGDSVTDDTTAINQAIIDGGAQKRPVFIPAGTYKVATDVIHLPQGGVEVYGVYRQTVLSGQNGSAIFAGPANTNLVMSGAYIHDLWFTTSDDVNATNAGVFFNKSDRTVIEHCIFNNQAFYGMSTADVSTRMMLVDNEAYHIHQNIVSTGMNPRFVQDGIVARNYIHDINQDAFDSRSHAIYIPGTYSDLVFAENIIDNCTSGPALGTNSGPLNQNLTCYGNVITNIFRIECLSITNVRNAIVSKNTIRTGGQGANGIQLGPILFGFTCSDNTINLDGSDATGIGITDPGPTSDPSTGDYLGVVSNNMIIKNDVVGRGSGVEIDSDGQNFLIQGNMTSNLNNGIYVISRKRSGTIDTVRKIIIDNNHLVIDRTLPNVHLDRCFGVSINGGAQNVVITRNSTSNCDAVVEIDSDGNSGFGQPNNIIVKDNIMWGQGLYTNNIGIDEQRAGAYNLIITDNILDSGNNIWNTMGGNGEGRNIYQANNRLISTPWTPKDVFTVGTHADVSQVDMVGFAAGNLTTLDNGHLGQTVKILSSGSLLVTNGTNLLLNGGSNLTLASGESLTVTQFSPGVWRETARSVAASSTFSSLAVTGNETVGGTLAVTGAVSALAAVGVSGQLLLKDGTLSSPSMAFNNETNTGWFRASTGDIQLSKQGVKVFELTNDLSIAIGEAANSVAEGIAIGYQAAASAGAGGSMSMGYQSAATAVFGIAHGFRSKSTGSNAIAIGQGTVTSGSADIALGVGATTGTGGIGSNLAVGQGATMLGNAGNALAVGQNATVAGQFGISIGFSAGLGNAQAGVGSNSIAIGSSTAVAGASSIGIGTSANVAAASVGIGNLVIVSGSNTVLLGSSAKSLAADGAVGIGQLVVVSGQNSIVIGRLASDGPTGNSNVVIGSTAISRNTTNAVSIGTGAQVSGSGGIAIGVSAGVTLLGVGASSVAVGNAANAAGTNSTALGVAATTGSTNSSTALGTGATAQLNNQIIIGTSSETIHLRGPAIMAGTTTFSGLATGLFSSAQYTVTGGAAGTTISTTGSSLAILTNSVVRQTISSTGVTNFPVQVTSASIGVQGAGTAASPALFLNGNGVNAGLYPIDAGNWALGTNGHRAMHFCHNGAGGAGVSAEVTVFGKTADDTSNAFEIMTSGLASILKARSDGQITIAGTMLSSQPVILANTLSVGSNLLLSGNTSLTQGATQTWSSRAQILSPADQQLAILPNAGGDGTALIAGLNIGTFTSTGRSLVRDVNGLRSMNGNQTSNMSFAGNGFLATNSAAVYGFNLTPVTGMVVTQPGPVQLFASGVNTLQIDANSVITMSGGLALPLRTVSSVYTTSLTDITVLANSAGGGQTVNLISAAQRPGMVQTVKNIGATGAVTVAAAGAQTIDGSSTQTLASQFNAHTYQSDGSNWFIIGKV